MDEAKRLERSDSLDSLLSVESMEDDDPEDEGFMSSSSVLSTPTEVPYSHIEHVENYFASKPCSSTALDVEEPNSIIKS